MAVGEKVLVRSFPSNPLVRQVYEEDGDSILVWRGTHNPDDLPAPCPKKHTFVVDLQLIERLNHEIAIAGENSPRLDELWASAIPYYNKPIN